MTTAQDVFNLAMAEIDSMAGGNPDISDNQGYKDRTVFLINGLLVKLYKISDTRTVTTGLRPMPTLITAIGDALPIDDVLALGVLPYGLASKFLVVDDANLANHFGQEFEKAIAWHMSVPSEFEAIEDVYPTYEE